jgi:hypothetical protein
MSLSHIFQTIVIYFFLNNFLNVFIQIRQDILGERVLFKILFIIVFGSKKCCSIRLYNRGGQLFSSAGHIAPLLVSRGPHFSQKGKVKAKKISLRGPDGARGPYVAPSCFLRYFLNDHFTLQACKSLKQSFKK